MCGIFGIINQSGVSFDEQRRSKKVYWGSLAEAFKYLMYVNVFRGDDGTGMFWAEKRGELYDPYHIKRAMPSSDFLTLSPVRDYVNSAVKDSPFLIGHTRASTNKAKGHSSAHPFEHGHILGVHNGVIPLGQIPGSGSDDWKDLRVDSDVLFRSISITGYQDVLPKTGGDFVLVWFDSNEQAIKIARNNGRTIFFCNVDQEENDVLIFSSELGDLKWAMYKAGLKAGNPYYLKADNKEFSVATYMIGNPTTKFTLETFPSKEKSFFRQGGTGTPTDKPAGQTAKNGTHGTSPVSNVLPFKSATSDGYPFKENERIDVDVICWQPKKNGDAHGKGELLCAAYPYDNKILIKDVRIVVTKVRLENLGFPLKEFQSACEEVQKTGQASFLGVKKTVVITSNSRWNQSEPKVFNKTNVPVYYTAKISTQPKTVHAWGSDQHASQNNYLRGLEERISHLVPPKQPIVIPDDFHCGFCNVLVGKPSKFEGMVICDKCKEQMDK